MYDSPVQPSTCRPVELATAVPSAGQRRLVFLLALVLVLATVAAWPHAETLGPALPGFVAVTNSMVAICDLLTAVLLFNQFIQYRTLDLLVLSSGYLFTAVIVTIQLSSFPGVFSPAGIVGGDANTAPWIWTIWHSVFPLSVVLYSVLRRPVACAPRRAVALAVLVTGGLLAAAVVFATRYAHLLPPVAAGGRWTPFLLDVVDPVTLALCVAALAALLLVRKDYQIVTLFLGLVVLAHLLDTANNLHSGMRYAVGFYVGRANSVAASLVLCVVFIRENALLLRYANRAAEDLARLNAELTASTLAKSRFFAAASHDLRQPFQAIRLFFDLLEGGGIERRPAAIEHLGKAITAAETLLDQLLDVARLESASMTTQPEEVDLGELLAALKGELVSLATQKGLALRIRPIPAVVRTDPLLVRRILFNLVTNAIRYTERGGVLVGLRRRPGRLLLEVWDTGIGIPADQADHVFEEFYQIGNTARDRARGLGLGLAIVKRLAGLLGCEVTLASRVGRGTVFRVAFPV